MEKFPHTYKVRVRGPFGENLVTSAENLPDLDVAPPKQFDGPGDQWSPEDLFMASISTCYILSFKAVAKFSKLDWINLETESTGILDRVDRKSQFTEITTKATLTIPAGGNKEKAEKLLSKANDICLVTNSLTSEKYLEIEVIFA